MMIWRNLDPKLLGELLVAAGEAFAAGRKNKRGTLRAPFRLPLAMAARPRRPARRGSRA